MQHSQCAINAQFMHRYSVYIHIHTCTMYNYIHVCNIVYMYMYMYYLLMYIQMYSPFTVSIPFNVLSQYLSMHRYTSIIHVSITLGAHAQEGYGTCPVCLSVCLLPLNRGHRSFLRST